MQFSARVPVAAVFAAASVQHWHLDAEADGQAVAVVAERAVSVPLADERAVPVRVFGAVLFAAQIFGAAALPLQVFAAQRARP